MGLEVASNIAELDQSWPLPGDPLNRGDDHLRLLKTMLKAQFPGANDNGFDKPITATEDELNFLAGVTSNINDQLTDHEARITANETALAELIEPGTVMAFFQAAAPTGWTQDTTASLNDSMMRIVNGVGGGTGGTDSAILNDKIPTHNHTASGSTSTTGGHEHNALTVNTGGITGIGGSSLGAGVMQDNANLRKATTGGGAHNHTVGVTVNNNSGSNWEPKYVSMILCAKD